MSDREVTVDLVAMFRQNTDAMLRAAACIGMVAEVYGMKGHTEESECLLDVVVSMASIYGAVTGEDPENFAELLDATASVVAGAAEVSPVVSRDKLNA